MPPSNQITMTTSLQYLKVKSSLMIQAALFRTKKISIIGRSAVLRINSSYRKIRAVDIESNQSSNKRSKILPSLELAKSKVSNSCKTIFICIIQCRRIETMTAMMNLVSLIRKLSVKSLKMRDLLNLNISKSNKWRYNGKVRC